MNEPPIIDHNPDERRPTNTVWWVLLGCLIFCWVGYLHFNDPDWWSLALGIGSGGVLATWAIEVTGNKPPASWGNKPTNSRRS